MATRASIDSSGDGSGYSAESESESVTPRARRGTRFTIGIGSPGQTSSGESESTNAGESWSDSDSTVQVKRPRKSSKADLASARGAADLFIGAAETLAVARYRTPDARMQPDERKMALDGLAASCKALPSDVVSQISSLSAPVMACFGFALYAIRLGELEQRRKARRQEESAVSQAERLFQQNNWQPVVPTEQYTPESQEFDSGTNGVPRKADIQNLQELQ